MLFNYKAVTIEGEKRAGAIEASNIEIAINSLQGRNLVIISIEPVAAKGRFSLQSLNFLKNRVKLKDIVILSRQLATLFEAKMSVMDSLRLISNQTQNPKLKESLLEIVEDIKGGSPMSQAMAKHPDIFSVFYVNMIKSGEESGKLEEIFLSLADHLERTYELGSKAKNALIYPAFVIATFFIVMILMLTFVIPKLTAILTDSGQKIPFYTQILIQVSNFFAHFGVFLMIGMVIGGVFLWKYLKTPAGRMIFSRFEISFPFVKNLYTKFYLSRITDNLETLLSSGVSPIRSLEISADVVGNEVYRSILLDSVGQVKDGKSISDSFSKYPEVPQIVTQMMKTGEETGKLDFILKTLGRYYKREVDDAVSTIISLIEPIMIVVLGGAVGILLVSILGPIYNMTAGI